MNALLHCPNSKTPKNMAQESDPTSSTMSSSVNQLQPADLIGGLGKGLVAVAKNSKADGQNTVSHRFGVRPRAGIQKEKDLQVGNKKNGGPHPEGQEKKSCFQSLCP